MFPGNWTHNLYAANAILYHWAYSVFWAYISISVFLQCSTALYSSEISSLFVQCFYIHIPNSFIQSRSLPLISARIILTSCDLLLFIYIYIYIYNQLFLCSFLYSFVLVKYFNCTSLLYYVYFFFVLCLLCTVHLMQKLCNFIVSCVQWQ